MYIGVRGLGQTATAIAWPSGATSPTSFTDGMYAWIAEPGTAISSLGSAFSNLGSPVAMGLLAVPVLLAGAAVLLMNKR